VLGNIEQSVDVDRSVSPVVKFITRCVGGVSDITIELLMLLLSHITWLTHPDSLIYERRLYHLLLH